MLRLTSVYLACKVEEHRIDATDLGKRVDRDAAVITSNEVTLLKGLKFHLNIYHPFRPLHGFLLQMQVNQFSTLYNKM